MCYARRQRSSWARIKLSKNSISTSEDVNTILRVSLTFLKYFTLLGLCFLLEFSRSLTRYISASFFVFHLSSCCSIFNDLRRSLPSDLVIILHRFAFVNTFSKSFFKLFRSALASPVLTPCFCAALLVYHRYGKKSTLFSTFFSFLHFIQTLPCYGICSFVHIAIKICRAGANAAPTPEKSMLF